MRPWTAALLALSVLLTAGGVTLLLLASDEPDFGVQISLFKRSDGPRPDAPAASGRGSRDTRRPPAEGQDQEARPGEQRLPLPNIIRPHTGPSGRNGAVVMPLPTVIHPTEPSQPGGTSGTAFFISPDGLMLTAAHVVQGCAQAQIFSRFLERSRASVLAIDDANDLALLRGIGVRPPAVLPLGRLAASSRTLLVIGYPGGGDPATATEAEAVLKNQVLPATVGAMADVNQLLWLHNAVIRQGFSGGPIIDPASGTVVGLVRATIKDGALDQVRNMPTSGLAIGPGATQLASFLDRKAASFSHEPGVPLGGIDPNRARRATVHAVCLR